MNSRNSMKLVPFALSLLCLAFTTTACSKSSSSAAGSTEDTSTSGSVASVVGGGVNGSNGGTVSMKERKIQSDKIQQLLASLNPLASAHASGECQTFTATNKTDCLNYDTSTTLNYSNCSFGSSTATWNGGAALSCSGHNTITRAETNGTTRTNSYGSVLTINTTGLTTYSGSGGTVAGGGTTVSTSGTLSINGVQLSAATSGGVPIFNHTITTGTAPLTYNATTGAVTGTVTTYHNLVDVTATSRVDVVMTSGCCTPVSGTIQTSFTTTHALVARFNGTSETLTFTGCGQATYSGPDGTAGNVTLANCI